ncbi:unnamed protein product, partial [Polarella glacialis]
FRDPSATFLQLLDFGSAKPSNDLAKAHSITGTLLYAAPEVFDGVYSRSCDLWSCGIVLFLLVGGQLPFQTSDIMMLRSMHRDPVLTGDCLFRGERWRKAPERARTLVRGLLTFDASSRLTALAALEHRWIQFRDSGELPQDGVAEQAEDTDSEEEGLSGLRRVGSSKIGLADLKRTYFVWNLADECDDDDELPNACGGLEKSQEALNRAAAPHL